MHISILTLFPRMFDGPFDQSIISRVLQTKLATVSYIDIRDFATDAYKSVDDHPYGGGHGMILRVDIVDKAITAAKKRFAAQKSFTVLLDPQGKTYSQPTAQRLSRMEHLILICAHYEGIDERIRTLVDEEISIGDYILTGGEIPAMVLVDSILRLLPGALKQSEATRDESFSSNRLEYPQYTRPEQYKNLAVPHILLSGDHAKIAAWRKTQALKRTKSRRPDLLTEGDY